MAVTTTYSWQFVQNLDLNPAFAHALDSNVDITSLANGGFAAVGNHDNASPHVHFDIFNSAGTQTFGGPIEDGPFGAIDQLSNGNLVFVSQDADSILYKVVNSVTGGVVTSGDLGNTNTSNADVAALAGGGFWIVNQDFVGGTDHDINVTIRNNDGSFANSFSLDNASAENDQGASVAGLDGGGAAVAWTRTTNSGFTQAWYAVYDSVGGPIKAATLIDVGGETNGSVNRNVSVTAMNGGGFAVVYEDNGWATGSIDITMNVFNAVGTHLAVYNIGNPGPANGMGLGGDDANPYVTRLANGMLAVSYAENLGFGDTDTRVKLIDPTNGAVLASRYVTGGELIDMDTDFSALAGFGLGHVAVYHTNLNTTDIVGEDLQAVRTSTGDGAHDTIVGDDFVDVMNGGAGNDTLNGRAGADTMNGGVGSDTMEGGTQNDSYFVDSAGDRIIEAAGGGSDTVIATASYTLAAGSSVELLRTSGSAGTTVINLTGNAFAQTLQGNAAANTLNGGAGIDVMQGFAGNDSYFVDNATDTAIETASQGTDSVRASASYTLGANQSIEALQTLGSATTYNVNLNGNSFNNTILGNAGASVINGRAGSDTLAGFGGADIFRFDTALGASNVDIVTDYNVAADTIQLQNAIFTALTATGTLAADAFHIGSAAADAEDRIIYNSTTGALYYDSGGTVSGTLVQFAKLATGLALTNADFVVI